MNVGLLEGITGRFYMSGESVNLEDPMLVEEGMVKSIREHLMILLNTRRGSVPHLPDYGLLDSVQASISNLRREIEETVKKYEPRLTNVRVSLMEHDPKSPFRAGFLLEARVINRSAKFHAFFSTLGSAQVERVKSLS